MGTYAEADGTAPDPLIRSNDAKADSAGRLWHGTMAYDETPGMGALYRLDPTAVTPARQIGDVGVSNGIAWSPDDSTMYYVDSPTRRIDAFEYDVTTGEIGARRIFARVDGGNPDGLCVDRDGGVSIGTAECGSPCGAVARCGATERTAGSTARSTSPHPSRPHAHSPVQTLTACSSRLPRSAGPMIRTLA